MTKVPFSNHGCVVARPLKHVGNGWAMSWNEVFTGSPEHTFCEAGTPVVSAGEEPVASGCADGAWCVRIQEGDPFIGHLLKMGCLYFALGAGRRDISNAEIIRHYNDDIWFGGEEAEGGNN